MEKIYADGMFVKIPENKPDFVVARVGFKVEEFKAFLDKNCKVNGWVDVDVLMGKEGKPYASLNTYTPEKPNLPKDPETGEEEPSSIPF